MEQPLQALAENAAGLAGEDIVCFAGEDWWFHNPHSNLHLMKCFSAHNRVLFVNSIGIAMPQLSADRFALRRVLKKLQSSRLASQLAFMMIEYIRRAAIKEYAGKRAEIGWILEDNQGMVAIADSIDSKVNREYWIYEKTL